MASLLIFSAKGQAISMDLHEECGVFGVMAKHPEDVAGLVYLGLYSLQHRGQESCGIVVNDDGVFVSHKDVGLVGEVFSSSVLRSFPKGTMAVGQTRYGTTGGTNRNNCQPIEVNHRKGHMALAHNGNLSNAAELRSALEMNGAIFHTSSDTETIAYIVTQERLKAPSIEEALSRAMARLEGAHSLVLMSPQKLICAALLRADTRRHMDHCFGKLCPACGRGRNGPGYRTGRNPDLQQKRRGIKAGALRKGQAPSLRL